MSGESEGGGLFSATALVTPTNLAFVRNRALNGGGLYLSGAHGINLSQLTFSENLTSGIGIGVATTSFFRNIIVANHAVGLLGELTDGAVISGVLWYSNTVNTTGANFIIATGEITGNPRFLADGYHLGVGSAAINAGLVSNVVRDIDGDARPLNGPPDLGADEAAPAIGISLVGPNSGQTGLAYGYTASVSPTSAAIPITYTWQASDQSPIFRTAGLSDTVNFTWETTGTKQITVTATNFGQPVTATTSVTITVPPPIASPTPRAPSSTTGFLPIVVKGTTTGW